MTFAAPAEAICALVVSLHARDPLSMSRHGAGLLISVLSQRTSERSGENVSTR